MRTEQPQNRSAQAGFSLLELVISLFVAVEILVAAALAFDVHNRIASIQVQVTDLQQSMRVAQYDLVRTLRSAGRGGLPHGTDPDAVFVPAATIPALSGIGIEVRNNVTGDARRIARGDNTSPQAIDGSDILAVRGCISGTAYQVDPSTFDWDADDDEVAGDAEGEAELRIPRTSVAGLLQSLTQLAEELQAYDDAGTYMGKFALVSPTSLQDYAVADIVDYTINGPASDPTEIVLTLDLVNNSTLNPIDPADGVRRYPSFMTASLGCFLEEYRYFAREVVGDTITPLRPRLTRARFEPGTELSYLGDDANFTLDLADGIFDLQIALGFDADFKLAYGGLGAAPGSFNDDIDWIGDDDMIFEADAFDPAQDRTEDDWLYNDPGDLPADVEWATHSFAGNVGEPVQLYYVRVSLAGRTARPDPSYQMPDFDTRDDGDWIEDHDYDTAPALSYKTGDNVKHRRRVLQTVVDMRNI